MNRISIIYALDEHTSRRIKRLAKDWSVSQAEVIRRAVQAAAEKSVRRLTPASVVTRSVKYPLPRTQAQTRRVIWSLHDLRHADDEYREDRSTHNSLRHDALIADALGWRTLVAGGH